MTIKLRYIEEKDLPKVRELRNKNREWFYDSGYINEERHRAWYNSVKDHYWFKVIELNGEVIGTVSSRYIDKATEIGNLTLDEAHTGHGYMTEAVKQLITSEGTYFATTKPHNVKSQAVFLRCGFLRCGETKDGDYVFKLYV